MGIALAVVGILVVFGLILAGSAVRILREYERGVIFRLGRLIAQKGPGLILLIPIIDRMVRVDLRTVTLNIPPQEVITRDNVPASVNAVCYFRVIDPNKAIVEVENFLIATSQIAQTTLRSVLGKAELERGRVLADDVRRGGELLGRLELTLGVDDLGPPLALGLGLARHRPLHRLGDLHVLDLDRGDLHAPGLGLLVDDRLQVLV